MKKRIITDQEFFDLCKKLSNKLPNNKYDFIYGVPRGGVHVAKMVSMINGIRFIEHKEDITQKTVIVDDIIDSGKTASRYNISHDFFALFWKEHRILRQGCPVDAIETTKDWIVFPWEYETNEYPAEDSVIRMLSAIGEDPNREGLKDTPKRVVKSWSELYSGYDQDPKDILTTTFSEGSCKEMVILKEIDFYSMCEHHILPFSGKISIGYIPDKKVVGISKLARLVEIFARRLQIQERMTAQIADAIMKHLEPLGCMVKAEAQHFCMIARGVKKENATMITSAIRGKFDEPQIRNEFLELIK